LEISFRCAFVNIEDKIADDAYNRAVSIIESSDDEATVVQYGSAGIVTAETELTIGLNVYLEDHSLKIQSDLGMVRHERRDGNLTDYLIRSQVQIAF